ncbi:MAG: DUF6352 family protein [Pseudomonadota bacterium]|nr:DUF6352 family protein [Pseudomonadota bacterium]
MPEFWIDSGYRLLDRTLEGELEITDDFLRAYFMRPEIDPVDESCDFERNLHESLMIEPRKTINSKDLENISDTDAAENYRVLLNFRELLMRAETLEKCYFDLFKSSIKSIPPLFINQLVQIILRNILDESTDALEARAAEIFFRDQKISVEEGVVIAADAEIINQFAENSGFGTLGQLVVEAGSKLKTMEMDILDDSNITSSWERSNNFDTALSLHNPGKPLNSLCRVLEKWIFHFFKIKVSIQPLKEIEDPNWVWHIGLDYEASQILNKLYNGEILDEEIRRQILTLFRMEFEDQNLLQTNVSGRPIYLAMAMNQDGLLRLKPQNLLTNLPLTKTI